jgi:hypothetical protein
MRPLLTGGIQSSLSSLVQYRSFKLSKCSNHLHHHAPWSSGGINRFRQTPESGFSFLNPFHNHQHVPERARKSVKTSDDEHVALPQLVQKAVQLGSVPSTSRRLIPENLFATRRLQRSDLRCCILLVGRNTRISDSLSSVVLN